MCQSMRKAHKNVDVGKIIKSPLFGICIVRCQIHNRFKTIEYF